MALALSAAPARSQRGARPRRHSAACRLQPIRCLKLERGAKEKYTGSGRRRRKKEKIIQRRRRRRKARGRERSNFLKTCPGKERAELKSYSSGESESGDAAPDRRLLPSLSPSPASLPPSFPPSLSVFFRTLSVPLGPCSRQHHPLPALAAAVGGEREQRAVLRARTAPRGSPARTGAAAASLPPAGEAPRRARHAPAAPASRRRNSPWPPPPGGPAGSAAAAPLDSAGRRFPAARCGRPAAAPGGSRSAGLSREAPSGLSTGVSHSVPATLSQQ